MRRLPRCNPFARKVTSHSGANSEPPVLNSRGSGMSSGILDYVSRFNNHNMNNNINKFNNTNKLKEFV